MTELATVGHLDSWVVAVDRLVGHLDSWVVVLDRLVGHVPTSPTCALTETLSLSTSAAFQSLLVIFLYLLQTFTAESNSAGGNLLRTSHRQFTRSSLEIGSCSISTIRSLNLSASVFVMMGLQGVIGDGFGYRDGFQRKWKGKS